MIATAGDVQEHDPGDGEGSRPYAVVSILIPLDEADRLARCRKDRGAKGMFAADCRPLVHAVTDELAAAKKRAGGS